VKAAIGATLQMEKAADKKLAEVTEKVAGLNDLAAVAEALGTSVSTREKLTFASSDFDQKFTGAASVAEQGVVSAPFKGSNGIYVFKVTNVDQAAFFTESDAQMNDAQLNYKYGQVLPYVVNEEGNVTDNTYLYF
jgi:parvulin-like peptidyl-prolyl isomerase